MNMQEVFNKVATHLIRQNGRSMDYGMGMYRGQYNRKCAVGCLIQDAHYNESLEGSSVLTDNVQKALINSGITINVDMLNMLKDLQTMHDNLKVYYWGDQIQEIAKRYELEAPEINKL